MKLFKSKDHWLAALACGVLFSLSCVVAVSYTALQLYFVLPEETYEAMYGEAWRGENARMLSFTGWHDFARAEESLRKRLNPATPEESIVSHFLLGALYQLEGGKARAIHYYSKTIENAEKAWLGDILYRNHIDDAHGELALLYYQTNKPAKALVELGKIKHWDDMENPELLSALQSSLEEPNRGDFHYQLGVELQRELHVGEARKELELALKLCNDPTTLMNTRNYLKYKLPRRLKSLTPMARYYSLAGQAQEDYEDNPQRAAAFYELAVKESPNFEWAHYQLGQIYRKMKDYKRAVFHTEKAHALNPDYYQPYINLGHLELDQEHYPKAIQYFSRALDLGSRLGEGREEQVIANIQNQLGYAYEQIRDNERARAYYRKALELAEESSEDYSYAEEALKRLRH